jgi:hypothetical protein
MTLEEQKRIDSIKCSINLQNLRQKQDLDGAISEHLFKKDYGS